MRVPHHESVLVAVLVSVLPTLACGNQVVHTNATTATGTGGGHTDSKVGQPCSTNADCDEKTFCRSPNNDCGPGACQERPAADVPPSGESGGNQQWCGCDGKRYMNFTVPMHNGIDIGPNSNCQLMPPWSFSCGDVIICGCPAKDDGDPNANCKGADVCYYFPDPTNPEAEDLARKCESAYGLSSDSTATCDNLILSGVLMHCDVCPGGDCTSYTCSADSAGDLTITCM